MAMGWASANLLARFKLLAGLPASQETPLDATIYDYLSLGQEHCINLWAQHFPHVMVEDPAIMTTSDSGATYQFAGSVFPIGLVEIRESPTGRLLVPGEEFDANADYVFEGDQIRIPDSKTKTFTNGPYARIVAPVAEISATTQPTLKPAFARVLIVYYALYLWANEDGNASVKSPDHYLSLFSNAWSGDTRIPGDTGIMGTLKTQLYGDGMGSMEPVNVMWWRQIG